MPAGDAKAFKTNFEAKVAAGRPRVDAMREARQEDPDGHQAYLDDYNASHNTTDVARQLHATKKKAA